MHPIHLGAEFAAGLLARRPRLVRGCAPQPLREYSAMSANELDTDLTDALRPYLVAHTRQRVQGVSWRLTTTPERTTDQQG